MLSTLKTSILWRFLNETKAITTATIYVKNYQHRRRLNTTTRIFSDRVNSSVHYSIKTTFFILKTELTYRFMSFFSVFLFLNEFTGAQFKLLNSNRVHWRNRSLRRPLFMCIDKDDYHCSYCYKVGWKCYADFTAINFIEI